MTNTFSGDAMNDKAELATAVCKVVSGCFLGIGAWMGEHWLQLLSGFFLILTYATQLYYHRRRDKRDEEFHSHYPHLNVGRKPNSEQP